MGNSQRKNWTILIYANGNNDLEPETWQTILDIEANPTLQNVNIVIEIGRIEAEFVKIIRPYHTIKPSDEKWSGVRRYIIKEGKAVLVADLGRLNMADANNLQNFVEWGITQYPADHFVLAFGGHGYQFVGAMPDYSQIMPYITGIPEISNAINKAGAKTGRKIDLLIADICYFNFIEVIYEFGKVEDHAIKTVLTYICDGPIQGLPYDKLIQLLDRYNAEEAVHRIVDALTFDLVALEINYNRLQQLKGLFNELAYWYSNTKQQPDISLSELLFANATECLWHKSAQSILENLEAMVLCCKRISNNNYGLLNVANTPTDNSKLIAHYNRLSFAQNNYWSNLLNKKPSHSASFGDSVGDMDAVALAPEEVYAYISIMNPLLSSTKKQEILGDMIRYKKWDWR